MKGTSEHPVATRAPRIPEGDLPKDLSSQSWRKLFVAQLAELAKESSDAATLVDLADSSSIAVRFGVAANPATPLDVLARLQNDASQFISWEAWRNIHARAIPKGQFQLLRMCSGLVIED
jgi:hypothetical protein